MLLPNHTDVLAESLAGTFVTDLGGIIASLLTIVESIVQGVLSLVGELIGIPSVVTVLESVFSGLFNAIITGDMNAVKAF